MPVYGVEKFENTAAGVRKIMLPPFISANFLMRLLRFVSSTKLSAHHIAMSEQPKAAMISCRVFFRYFDMLPAVVHILMILVRFQQTFSRHGKSSSKLDFAHLA